MFVIEDEYFLMVKKFLRLIIICFWVLFMVSEEVLINERLKEIQMNLNKFWRYLINAKLKSKNRNYYELQSPY